MDSEDNTVMFHMKRQFSSFLSAGTSRQSISQLISNSDFDSTLDTKNPSQSSTLPELNETHEMAIELAKSKGLIHKLESDKSEMETSNKRARIDYQLELDNAKTNLHKDSSRYGDLQQKVKMMNRKEEEYKLELRESKKAWDAAKQKYENETLLLRQDLIEAEQSLQEVESNLHKEIGQLQNENKELKANLNVAQQNQLETEIRVKHALRRSVETNGQLQNLEEFRMKSIEADKKIKDLEFALRQKKEETVLVKAMKDELDKLPELKQTVKSLTEENQYLKNKQENTYLLEEELKVSKNRLERLQEKSSDYSTLETKCQDLTAQLAEWKSVAPDNQSPYLLGQLVKELTMTNTMMLQKQGQLISELSKQTTLNEQSARQLTELENRRKLLETKVDQLEQLLKRTRKRLSLVSMERDSYKGILDSYDNDTTVSLGSVRNDRIKQLEAITMQYHTQTETLENTNKQLMSEIEQAGFKIAALEGALANSESHVPEKSSLVAAVDENITTDLRSQIATLQEELVKQQEKNNILESRLENFNMQGLYDPTKTKVVHFVMNPFYIKKKQRSVELAELRDDNERLSARVKVLEENREANVSNLTLKVEENMKELPNPKHVEELKQQLESSEMKNQRLIEVFKMKSKEFREICYELSGYRIDVLPNGQYKAMSMYAEAREDYLLFQRSESRELQLLGTEYSSQLGDKCETYLTKGHSIPAFLSALTIDLFNSQTMIGQDSMM